MSRENKYGQPIGEALLDWQPLATCLPPTQNGYFCQLVPVDSARHAVDLFEAYHHITDDRDWTYIFSERPESLGAMQTYLQAMMEKTDRINRVVIDRRSGKAVGLAAYMRIDPANGSLELGNIIWSPLMKQNPIGTEAIFMMLSATFDHLGYRRCEWKCDSLNAPSRHAALRLGFQYEGTFRQAIVLKGCNRDTDWFSITNKEWPALREGFIAWLSEENFDAQGQQCHRLHQHTSM